MTLSKRVKGLKVVGMLVCALVGTSFSGHILAQTPAPEQAVQGLPAAQATPGVNVNTASAQELATALSGVGLTKAQAIVEFRELNGNFLALDEVTQVKGIGAATLEKNKAVIRFQ